MIPNILMWAAAAGAAAWKTSQLIRVPHEKGLRIVTTCTILVFIALSAQLIVTIPGLAEHVPGQLSKLIQNVVLTFFFALLIVLLHSTLAPTELGRRGYLEIALSVATSAGLTAAFFASAPAVRGASYSEATGHPAVLAFYWIGNLYMLYATARGASLAWTSAAHIQSRVRHSLRVAAAGLAVCSLGTHLPRVASTTGRLAFDLDPIPGTATWTTPVLALGIAVFFLGIGYPGVRTGIIKTHLWFETRRHYRQLRPLWAALHRQFPNIALFTPTSPTREAFHLRYMRLRMYRRIIECRDGLVSLSPHTTAPVTDSHSPARQAQLVTEALTRSSRDTELTVTSIIAAPTGAGMDADTHELLALSRAFTRLNADHPASATEPATT